MLCATCRGVLQHSFHVISEGEKDMKLLVAGHHPSPRSLLDAIEAGCWLCVKFWSHADADKQALIRASTSRNLNFEASLPPREQRDEFAMMTRAISWGLWCTSIMFMDAELLLRGPKRANFEMMLTVIFGKESNNEDTKCMITMQVTKEGIAEEADRVRPMNSATTASDETLAFLKRWLSTCSSTHRRCMQVQDDGWRPTRLLRIAPAGDMIYLIETKQEPVSEHYVTLSHRWASKALVMLEDSTEDMLKAGLTISQMPQCWADAVDVCKRLAISYLWIDSICIKQRDLEDWRKEAGLMQKVYSRSYFNISSLAAADSSQSFYINRDPASPRFDEPLQSRLQVLEDRIGLGDEPKNYRLTDGQIWDREVENVSLNYRGWVLQERLLPPRIVYFGHRQALFECREAQAAESVPDGLPMDDLTMTESIHLQDMGTTSTTEAQSKALNLRDIWARIVRNYSRCGLSFTTDKMIALAGIASQLALIYGDEYVVGLWRGSLQDGLCWHCRAKLIPKREKQNPPYRPQEYRAPSFSWLSLDRQITFGDYKHSEALFEITSVDVQLAGDNPYTGPINSAHLIIRGRLQKLYVLRHFDAFHARNGLFSLFINGRTVRGDNSVGPAIALDDHPWYFDLNGKQNLYSMPVRRLDSSSLEVLLLECQDYSAAVFRRVGFVTCHYEKEREVVMAECAEESAYPCLHFENGKHTIKLV